MKEIKTIISTKIEDEIKLNEKYIECAYEVFKENGIFIPITFIPAHMISSTKDNKIFIAKTKYDESLNICIDKWKNIVNILLNKLYNKIEDIRFVDSK